MIANTEQILVQKFRVLPEEKQAQVLEFVEELEAKVENSNEIEVSEDKQNTDEEAKHKRLMRFVGIARSKNGNVSERVDEILAEGINKEEGWSLP